MEKTLSQNAHCFCKAHVEIWDQLPFSHGCWLAACYCRVCLFVPGRLLFPTEYSAVASTVSCSSSCALMEG